MTQKEVEKCHKACEKNTDVTFSSLYAPGYTRPDIFYAETHV